MRRLLAIAVPAVLLLGAPASAPAKGIMGATVCGADGCREVAKPDHDLLGGGAVDGAAAAARAVRAAERPGRRARATSSASRCCTCRAASVCSPTTATTWMQPLAHAELRAIARQVTPFAASELPASVRLAGAAKAAARRRAAAAGGLRGRRRAARPPRRRATAAAMPGGSRCRARRSCSPRASCARRRRRRDPAGGRWRRRGSAVAAEPLAARRCTTSMVVHRPDEDAALVERARAGEPEAFARIVERHQGAAFRVAWVLCGNAADAEEATQDAFVKAHRALGPLPRGGAAAARGCWRSPPTRRATAAARPGAASTSRCARRASAPGRAAPSSETLALAADRDAGLRAALARLGGADREVLWLRYFAELSEAETAAALGCRHGTVKSRTSRALARLRPSWRTTMADLERRLPALAADAFPPVPDVRAAVAARIAAAGTEAAATGAARPTARGRASWPGGRGLGRGVGRRGTRARRAAARRPRRRVLALALALVLLPTAAVAAVPDARHAVLEWLGLEHVRVERVPPRAAARRRWTAPTSAGASRPSRRPGGRRASPSSSRARSARPTPSTSPTDGVVSLAYDAATGARPRRADRPRAARHRAARGRRAATTSRRRPGPDTRVEPVRRRRRRGVFLSGEPHELLDRAARRHRPRRCRRGSPATRSPSSAAIS